MKKMSKLAKKISIKATILTATYIVPILLLLMVIGTLISATISLK